MGGTIFNLISVIYVDHLPTYNCSDGMFTKITAPLQGARKRKRYSVETGFSDEMNSIVFRYSATNNCLPSNIQFRLQGNADKVNRI
jgi:hypothetical protein